MSKQYLILIEQLVREGRSEREIDRIVERAVSEDVHLLRQDDEPDEPEQPLAA
jgi:hypothetical protein